MWPRLLYVLAALIIAAGVWYLWSQYPGSGAAPAAPVAGAESATDPILAENEGVDHADHQEENDLEQLVSNVRAFEVAFHQVAWSDTPEMRQARIEEYLHPTGSLLNEVDLRAGTSEGPQATATESRMTVTATIKPEDVEEPWLYDEETAYVIATVTKVVTDEAGEEVNRFRETTERNWVKTPEGWRVHSNASTVPLP